MDWWRDVGGNWRGFPLECTSAGQTDTVQTHLFLCNKQIVVLYIEGHHHHSFNSTRGQRSLTETEPRFHSFAFRVPYIYASSFLQYSFINVYSLSIVHIRVFSHWFPTRTDLYSMKLYMQIRNSIVPLLFSVALIWLREIWRKKLKAINKKCKARYC